VADVRPFSGLRFPGDADIAAAFCPPFDIISPDEQRALYQRSPFNVVRLEYGETSAADTPTDNRYTRAAATLREWIEGGVLIREESPTLYVYDQEFAHLGQRLTRRGLFARVRLHNWDEGIIRPHERTLSRPKEDRLLLLRACRLNVSPVLAVYRDPAGDIAGALEETRARSPILEATDSEGQGHRLYPIGDGKALDRISALFRDKSVYIIDGHHRYETALAYRDERRAQSPHWTGEEGENFVLLTLVAREDPGLVVLPSHRLLRTAALPADFTARLGRTFDIEDVSGALSDGGWPAMESLLAAAASRRGIAFAIASRQPKQRLIATVKDPDQAAKLMPTGAPASWRRLDAAVLQELVLSEMLGVSEESMSSATEPPVQFTDDGEEALRLVESGSYALAFFLNATPAERVLEVADAGERMPLKSTFFYPKLPTGLVMYPLD
jgi:uncharacterized protein (DUF1015 family)